MRKKSNYKIDVALKETQFKENQFKGGTLKKKITPKLKN
jgi:hypothetical protein